MVDGQVANELMALYGKLRRATDEQARTAIKARIDELVAQLGSDVLKPPRRGAPRDSTGID